MLLATFAEEECFLYLAWIDETSCEATLASKTQKKWVKAQYDKNVKPCSYLEGGIVLVADKENDKLGASKFEPMRYVHYIVKHVLEKWAYELVDYDAISLGNPRNGIYLKKYYE